MYPISSFGGFRRAWPTHPETGPSSEPCSSMRGFASGLPSDERSPDRPCPPLVVAILIRILRRFHRRLAPHKIVPMPGTPRRSKGRRFAAPLSLNVRWREMTTRYEYSRKPRKCPACKESTVATILWGMPAYSPDLENELEAGHIVLGGCCVSDDDPTWQCTSCNMEIFRKETKG